MSELPEGTEIDMLLPLAVAVMPDGDERLDSVPPDENEIGEPSTETLFVFPFA